MSEEKVLEAMEYIDAALVQEASAPAPGKKRKFKHIWIAACLCLLVSGTAFAAQIAGIPQLILQVFSRGEGSHYTVAGGAAFFPAESLSEEIRALAEEYPEGSVGKAFNTWEEMEGFIGVNLQDNPVLESASAGKGTKINNVMGKYVANILTNAQGLESVWFFGGYYLHGNGDVQDAVSIMVQGALCTEQVENQEYGEGRFYQEGTRLTQESYTAPSGLKAEIIQVERPERGGIEINETGSERVVTVEPCTDYIALFSLNGIRYTLRAEYDKNPELALSTLKEVLDGFVVESED